MKPKSNTTSDIRPCKECQSALRQLHLFDTEFDVVGCAQLPQSAFKAGKCIVGHSGYQTPEQLRAMWHLYIQPGKTAILTEFMKERR